MFLEGVVNDQYIMYSFDYDNIGNPLSDGINTYTWDGRLLSGISNPSNTIELKNNSDGYRTV